MANLFSFTSNPIWRARGLVTYVGPANAPTLWVFDVSGYVSAAGGRSLTSEENNWVAQYNNERSTLNAQNQILVDGIIGRLLPISDGVFNQLTGNEPSILMDNLRWLNDHQQGSDFYNDISNYHYSPNDQDGEAMLNYMQLLKQLGKTGIKVNTDEIGEKVNSGMTSPIAIDLGGRWYSNNFFILG